MSKQILFDPALERTIAKARRSVEAVEVVEPKLYRVGMKYYGKGACGQAPGSDKHCYRHGKRLCDMSKLGGLVQVAGAASFRLRLEPGLTPYFEPIAIRCVVTDASNSNLNYRCFFTAVAINQHPQENVHDTAPTAATTAGWWSDDWQDPDIYAVPVGWGIFSKEANSYPLDIYGYTRGISAGVTVEVSVSLYGNPYTALPHGCPEPGKPVPENGGGRGSAPPVPQ